MTFFDKTITQIIENGIDMKLFCKNLIKNYKIYVIMTLSDHAIEQKTDFSIFLVNFFKGEGYNMAKFGIFKGKF